MADGEWTDLTDRLPALARKGDHKEIQTWLAEWSRDWKVEAVVWIDHGVEPKIVKAATSGDADKVVFPEWLLAKLDNASEQMELWHNHPQGEDEPSIAVPGADDIATAMRAGVTGVGTVDDEGRWIRIEAKPGRIAPPRAARAWVDGAIAMARTGITRENGPPADAEADVIQAVIIAEAALGAAEAAGLVRTEGLSETGKASGEILARAMNATVGTPPELAARTPKPGNDEGTVCRTTTQAGKATEEEEQWRTQPQSYWGR